MVMVGEDGKDEEIEGREGKISDLEEVITVKEAELNENRTEIGSFQVLINYIFII